MTDGQHPNCRSFVPHRLPDGRMQTVFGPTADIKPRLILLKVVEKNERPDLCGPCGGNCCKQMPGGYMPSDFGTTPEEVEAQVRELVSSGAAVMDWWDPDRRSDYEKLYFLRPRTLAEVRETGTYTFEGWEGQCANLGNRGCRLEWDKRPWGCRALIPAGRHGNCMVAGSDNSKWDCAAAWRDEFGSENLRRFIEGLEREAGFSPLS